MLDRPRWRQHKQGDSKRWGGKLKFSFTLDFTFMFKGGRVIPIPTRVSSLIRHSLHQCELQSQPLKQLRHKRTLYTDKSFKKPEYILTSQLCEYRARILLKEFGIIYGSAYKVIFPFLKFHKQGFNI